MSMNDLMSDFVARLNNAVIAEKDEVRVVKTNLAKAVATKLTKLGYLESFEEDGYDLKISLNPQKIAKISRYSKPGQRQYVSYQNMPKITGGKGFNLLTTSKGVLTHVEAKQEKIGGEVLFQIY
jgi:small subunit ribosomal protein S8